MSLLSLYVIHCPNLLERIIYIDLPNLNQMFLHHLCYLYFIAILTGALCYCFLFYVYVTLVLMIVFISQSFIYQLGFLGNYGNSLDQSLPNASSTTPHVYPVFDGSHYHHIPWTDTKPCVVVNSQWEDNSYRIAFLNILLTICSDLERNISRAQDMMEEDGVQEEEIKVHVCLSIDHFLEQTK